MSALPRYTETEPPAPKPSVEHIIHEEPCFPEGITK